MDSALIWLLPWLWRGIKRVFGAIARFFGGGGTSGNETKDEGGGQRRDSP